MRTRPSVDRARQEKSCQTECVSAGSKTRTCAVSGRTSALLRNCSELSGVLFMGRFLAVADRCVRPAQQEPSPAELPDLDLIEGIPYFANDWDPLPRFYWFPFCDWKSSDRVIRIEPNELLISSSANLSSLQESEGRTIRRANARLCLVCVHGSRARAAHFGRSASCSHKESNTSPPTVRGSRRGSADSSTLSDAVAYQPSACS